VPLLWIDGRLVDLQTPYESAEYVDVNAGHHLFRAWVAGFCRGDCADLAALELVLRESGVEISDLIED
jgi:hypothetical protein